MQRLLAFSDKLTGPALRLIATLHLFFFASFVATLLMTAVQ